VSNPSRQKGTSEETRIVRAWNQYFDAGHDVARRNPAAAPFDVTVEVGVPIHPPIQVLATRADRGECLYTLRELDFMHLFGNYEFHVDTPVHIEAKRYKRFSLHSIFREKFGS